MAQTKRGRSQDRDAPPEAEKALPVLSAEVIDGGFRQIGRKSITRK